jgi:CVNH domain
MPFSLIDGCREFTINKNVFSVDCKKADGQTWVDSTIDLDQYFGNIEGKFTWGEKTSSGKYIDDQVDLDLFL